MATVKEVRKFDTVDVKGSAEAGKQHGLVLKEWRCEQEDTSIATVYLEGTIEQLDAFAEAEGYNK